MTIKNWLECVAMFCGVFGIGTFSYQWWILETRSHGPYAIAAAFMFACVLILAGFHDHRRLKREKETAEAQAAARPDAKAPETK